MADSVKYVLFARDVRLGDQRFFGRVWYAVSAAFAESLSEYHGLAVDIRDELPGAEPAPAGEPEVESEPASEPEVEAEPEVESVAEPEAEEVAEPEADEAPKPRVRRKKIEQPEE